MSYILKHFDTPLLEFNLTTTVIIPSSIVKTNGNLTRFSIVCQGDNYS